MMTSFYLSLFRKLRQWMLAIAILLGVCLYFAWMALPFGKLYEKAAFQFIGVVQPILIFSMLFVTFCKVNIKRLSLKQWHVWGLLLQGGSFLIAALLHQSFASPPLTILLQAAMLCFITPTATAAVVVVSKLQGNVEETTTYTILNNLLAALFISLLAPFVYDSSFTSLWTRSGHIISRIFPMLVAPLFLAWITRRYFPRWHHLILSAKDLAFYLWAVSLVLAITVSTRSIIQSQAPLSLLLGIGAISLIACGVQFLTGRRLGKERQSSITASQSIGQKNTVFLMWVGHTYFHPLAAIAGGFYSIYHNLWNSYQLVHSTKAERQP